MFNPLTLKAFADLTVTVLTSKDIEFKDIALQAVTGCLSGLNIAKQLGLQAIGSEYGQVVCRPFIDLADNKLANIDRLKQGLNPIDALSGEELLVFRNIETDALIELTQKEFNANFNASHFNGLDGKSTEIYWRNRLNEINNLKIEDVTSFCKNFGVEFTEENGIIRGLKNGVEVVNIDKATNSGWVQVGIYKKGGSSRFLSGIRPGQFNGNIEYRYEVRGNFYNKIGSHISIRRADGSVVNIPIEQKKEMIHGMMVYYNVPDFTEFAVETVEIPEDIIHLNAQEHKRYAINILAEKFHNGETAKGIFSPEIEAKLEKIYAKNISLCSLSGYEIHHDGNRRMQFIPRDIHCRRASHLSGSWLMNHKNYGLDLLCQVSNVDDRNNGFLQLSPNLIPDAKLTEALTSFSELDKYLLVSISERKEIIVNLTDKIKNSIGLKDTSLVFKSMPVHCFGSYSKELNRITINENLLQSGLNFEEIVNVVLHEVRHSIQCDAIINPSMYDIPASTIEMWRYEINNYMPASLDFEAYSKQSRELDANEWARQYTSLLIA